MTQARATPAHPFLDSAGPVAFAHRGGAKEAPENTMAAFAHAVSLGYRYVETDVHATADGVVVTCHDASLLRTTGRPGLIRDLPWREVAAAGAPGGEAVPSLEEALASWPGLRWNIDAKHQSVIGPLCDLVARSGALPRVCITSFSDRSLATLRRRLGPDLCSAAGPRGVAGLRLASLLPDHRPLERTWRPAVVAQVPVRYRGIPLVDRRLLGAAHASALAVHVWTVDDEAEMDRLIDLGADGIMTDRPSALKDVMQRRGLWSGR
ncbi:MAG: glycerophosphodiester phosphodiesterase [Acidimicrobiales bacterium]